MKTNHIQLSANIVVNEKISKEIKDIEVQHVEGNYPNIILRDILFEKNGALFIEWTHTQLTSIIDCSGCVPYEIWYFNDKKEFTGKAFSLGTASGSFMIQTQAKYVLIWNQVEAENISKKLQSFKCNAFEWEAESNFKTHFKNFSKGYGIFPYWIIKHDKSPCFTQIPIQINPKEENLPGWIIDEVEQYKIDSDTLFEQLLIEKGKAYYSECCKKEGKPLRMALVVSPTKAIYFTEEMEASLSDTIPSGGVLLDTMGEIIASHTIHYLKD